MQELAGTPAPPYFTVIFTSILTEEAASDYRETAEQMVLLAENQPGYLGVESVRDANGVGITVSYWQDEESIMLWKKQLDHIAAQQLGKEKWYQSYRVSVAKVERAYGFEK